MLGSVVFKDTPTSVRMWQVLFAIIALMNAPALFDGTSPPLPAWLGVIGFAMFCVSYQFRHQRISLAEAGSKMSTVEKATFGLGIAALLARVALRFNA